MKRFDRELHLIMWAAETDGAGGITDWDILLDGCRKGDRKAQKRLFDRLSPKMFPLCIRYMGNREAAEDVLQEGFITLFSRLDSYAGKGSFEGWARRLFVNTALMQLRKNDALAGSDDIDAARSLSSEAPSAVETLGYRELMKLIASLPEGLRTVFNLYAVEHWSHKQIAQKLDISVANSKVLLSRARAELQQRLKVVARRKDQMLNAEC